MKSMICFGLGAAIFVSFALVDASRGNRPGRLGRPGQGGQQQGSGSGFGGGGTGGGGGFGGGGMGGGFGGGGGRPGGRWCDVEFIDLTEECATTTPCELPNGSEGVFVCRNVEVHPRDMDEEEDEEGMDVNICVPTDQGLEGDECICCGDCPEPCTGSVCDLTYRNGTTVVDGGVLVSVTHHQTTEERCVTSGASLRLVALGIGTCV